jgi:DNA repair exonuclease SbcCD nuclease subunit
MPITFLHAADIHLDSPLRGLERYENAPIERIRGATRTSLARLVDLAMENRVDFVLISGDLYDGTWPDYNTGLFLTGQLGRLRDAKIPVFLIAGNHDAANKMTRTLSLPENVHFLRADSSETRRLDDLGVAIHGQSFARAAVLENLAEAYPLPARGWLNIGLLHTGLNGADGHEPYAPCTIEDLRAKGYDYWALGHIHTRHTPCTDPLVVFPGNTQGRHIRETGEKGCLIVSLEPNGASKVAFHRLDSVRWDRLRIDASEASTEAELLDRVAARLDTLLSQETDSDRLLASRIEIFGASSLHHQLHAAAERYINEVRSLAFDRGQGRVWIEKVVVQTKPSRTIVLPDGPIEEIQSIVSSLRGDLGACEELAAELEDLRKKLPSEFLLEADSFRLDDPAWIETLLDQVEPVLYELILSPDRSATS